CWCCSFWAWLRFTRGIAESRSAERLRRDGAGIAGLPTQPATGEAGLAQPIRHVGAPADQLPDETIAEVFNHQDDRTLVEPKVVGRNPAIRPGRSCLEGWIIGCFEAIGIVDPQAQMLEVL